MIYVRAFYAPNSSKSLPHLEISLYEEGTGFQHRNVLLFATGVSLIKRMFILTPLTVKSLSKTRRSIFKICQERGLILTRCVIYNLNGWLYILFVNLLEH